MYSSVLWYTIFSAFNIPPNIVFYEPPITEKRNHRKWTFPLGKVLFLPSGNCTWPVNQFHVSFQAKLTKFLREQSNPKRVCSITTTVSAKDVAAFSGDNQGAINEIKNNWSLIVEVGERKWGFRYPSISAGNTVVSIRKRTCYLIYAPQSHLRSPGVNFGAARGPIIERTIQNSSVDERPDLSAHDSWRSVKFASCDSCVPLYVHGHLRYRVRTLNSPR